MGRILILGAIILLSKMMTGQNLVLNPDFEELVPHKGDLRIYVDSFYAKHWFAPTGGTVDIYRSDKLPSQPNINLQPYNSFNRKVFSGSYCLGFIFLNWEGYMEHITGSLFTPLEKGKYYSVSFYIKKHPTSTPFIPKGLGWKFSKDSIIFKDCELGERGKPEPFYDYLFLKHKVYADFEIQDYVLDTSWVKYTSIYKAKGGEKFITLGKFADRNDEKYFDHFIKQRTNPTKKSIAKFIKSDKSLVCKRFFDKKVNFDHFDYEDHNYYYLDMVEVIQLDSLEIEIKKNESSVVSNSNNELQNTNLSNEIDLDPATSIPSEREIIIDKGFEGEMKLELAVRLKGMEKYVLQYGKNCEIIFINTSDSDKYSEMKYVLNHPAKKLRKKPIKLFMKKTNQVEMKLLKENGKEVREIAESNFEGIMIKNIVKR